MDQDEILVKIEGVSKKYCKDVKRSLRYGLQELAGELFLHQKPTQELRRQEFWALQDVNFELKRGEAFGIIGVNGSGKTSLLKIMQGLLKPTQGTVTLRGRVGALISLGAGFQPLLTGRENIYVNAAILGVSMRHVERRLDAIIGFADLGDFIDAPIKTYSSGMRGRLGFAIATHLVEPDVLLLDEVLATGDWKFKDRCFQRMEEIVSSGATVVFVSHLMPKVEKFCNRALLLHKGVVKGVGPSAEICQMFYDLPEIERPPNPKHRSRRLANLMRQDRSQRQDKKTNQTQDTDKPQSTNQDNAIAPSPAERSDAAIDNRQLTTASLNGKNTSPPLSSEEVLVVELLDRHGVSQSEFRTLDAVTVQVYASLHPRPPKLKVVVQFLTPGDEISVSHFPYTFVLASDPIANNKIEINSDIDSHLPSVIAPPPIKVECSVPQVFLRAGKYRISVTVTPIDPGGKTRARSRCTATETFFIKDKVDDSKTQKANRKKSPGLVYMPVNWTIDTPTSVETLD